MASRFKINLTSFENASLLRKLTILYFLMSVIPVAVLYYLYTQLRDYGQLTITEKDLSNTLFLVVSGVAVGYAAMRSLVIKVIDISRKNQDTLENILGHEKIKNLWAGSSNEIALLAKSFNEITGHLEENVRNLELAKRTLHSVLEKVGEGISTMDNIDTFLELIMETVAEALQSNLGALFLKDDNNKFYIKTIYGKDPEECRKILIDPVQSAFRDVYEARQSMVIDKISHDTVLSGLLGDPVLCAPLLLHDKILGIIAVSARRGEEPFNEEECNLLNNLALQTAVAIENSKLNEDAERTYFETISALAMAVEAKDVCSRGHIDRVSKLSIRIAEALDLSEEDIRIIRDASKLHDIGKIGVTDDILKKPGPLNAQEMEMMKKHPEIGEGIIKPIRSLKYLCDAVRHHHEKLDGTGYPDGLKGDEISFPARVLAVVDIYDALTSNRYYRKAYPPEKAVASLKSQKGKIDQSVVDALAGVVLKQPV